MHIDFIKLCSTLNDDWSKYRIGWN